MKEKKRILFVMHLPPPIHGASMMGKYTHDSELLNTIFDCKYINLSASSNLEEVGHISIKKFIFMITNLKNVITTVIRFKPDICYVTPTSWGWAFYRDFLLIQLLKWTGVKIILHFHNKASKTWVSKYYNKILLKIFFKKVKIILLGKELYAEKAPFIDEDNVFYCPNGIPAAIKTKINLDKKSERTHFLFLSNMMEEKGIYILLKACSILKKRKYTFQCDFIGKWKDVTEVDFLQNIVSHNLEDNVTAHGPKYGSEKAIFFEHADVFVFPTYYQSETFGLVLLEAMDYSLPCLSTVNGAIPSVITEGVTGYCLPQKDVDALVDRMIWMIEHPNERKIMGEVGNRRFEEQFTLKKYEEHLIDIFCDLAQDSDV
ncbi:glycosyltransferase [Zobellia amurskyensis]|uniref:Glycosyltransferase n=1 Tax=Zobellia amurskyensis TaxID=248905 RepID=A0A7X2ZX99_9FLAO|nr:glycosyltransferase family 4 protein [Zobellia amurskyensis]MUH38095.1 glycosyltransferase [Zobellia amurskyensis]